MPTQVQTNGELDALHKAGIGYIFNHFVRNKDGVGAERYNVLHAAACRWVRAMLKGQSPSEPPPVRKLFDENFGEMQSWLVNTVGIEGQRWKRCDSCRPGGLPAGDKGLRERSRSRTLASREQRTSLSTALQGIATWLGSWRKEAVFAPPGSLPIKLRVKPELASWDQHDHPRQQRLRRYLDEADELLRPRYERSTGPLALSLDVGLQAYLDLLDQRDLDNYLFPLADRIRRNVGDRLVCVRGTKRHADSSFVQVDDAIPALTWTDFDCCYTVRTTANWLSESSEFKEQIRDQIVAARLLPSGPVRMQLCFTAGTPRNWLSMWKPSIDALGQILGHSSLTKKWSPQDGRIVDLGLLFRVDATVGNDVVIAIAARNIQPQ